MTKLYYLLLFCLIPLLDFAQTPVPFPTQNASWRFEEYSGTGAFIRYHFFYLAGDSTYQGENWSTFANNRGLIREDAAQKVWFIPHDSTQPELLFDYQAAVGDTIYGIRTLWGKDTVVVGAVNLVQDQGANRKYMEVFSVRLFPAHYQWIEGIGSSSGVTYNFPQNTLSGGFALDCFTTLASSDPNNNCLTSIGEEQIQTQLKISPNPSPGLFRVSMDRAYVVENMEVRDVRGRLVYTSPEYQEQIDLSAMREGVYILRIKVAGQYTHQKLLVQRH